MSSLPEAALRRAFLEACALELEALKPGNVHVHAAGHGMSVADFRAAAAAAAPPLCRRGSPVGRRIREAVAASRAAVPANINLGIILLAAPLLAAAEAGKGPLAARVASVLRGLTLADAEDAFVAIRDANPGGLGRATEQDVAAAPTVTLRAAMALAAGRDRVARQYASDYADVFEIGVPRIAAARRRGLAPAWAASLVYLDFLTRFPDSHVARKFGEGAAEAVRQEAAALRASLPESEAAAFPALLAFDRALKERGLNPGTSADLTVASLLASGLADMLKAPASDIG